LFFVAKLTELLQKVFLSVLQEKTEDTLNSEVKTNWKYSTFVVFVSFFHWLQ